MTPNLHQQVAAFISRREATLAMIERATPGPWCKCGGATPHYCAIAYEHGYIVFGMADKQVDKEHGERIKAPDYKRQQDNATMIALSRTDWPQSIRNEIALVKGLVSQACLTAYYNGHSDGFKPHPNGGLYWENYLSKEAETALRAILEN